MSNPATSVAFDPDGNGHRLGQLGPDASAAAADRLQSARGESDQVVASRFLASPTLNDE
jgi:hypothetical protein